MPYGCGHVFHVCGISTDVNMYFTCVVYLMHSCVAVTVQFTKTLGASGSVWLRIQSQVPTRNYWSSYSLEKLLIFFKKVHRVAVI